LVQRYRHPVFALQYDLSEGTAAHLGDIDWYAARLRGRSGPILELGAGTGRLTIPLAAGGHRLFALDIALPMLELLRRKPDFEKCRIELVCGDLTGIPARGPFAAAVCGYNSFGCLLDRGRLRRGMDEIARALAPGAPFCFDVAVHRPEDRLAGPKRFAWQRWTAPDGFEIRRRTTLRHRPERERLELRHDYRWRDEHGRTHRRRVPFAMNTWSPDVYFEAGRAAGFELAATDERTFVTGDERRRMWIFVELRRGSH
jgi:SAM-dependent methyltransferase